MSSDEKPPAPAAVPPDLPVENPLRRYPVAYTHSPEEAREALSRVADVQAFDLPQGPQGFLAQLSYVALNGIDLTFTSTASEVAIRFGSGRRQVRQQIGLSGTASSVTLGATIEVTPERSCIVGPDADVTVHSAAGHRQVVLRLDYDAVVSKLEKLIGSPLKGKLTFDPEADIRDAHQAQLRRATSFLLAELDAADVKPSGLVMSEMEQLLLVSFLLGSRHPYSDLLRSEPRALAPWQVRLAEEYIAANWNRPLSIEELAATVRVSARSLFRTFRQYRGYSPMGFVKQVRLKHARDMLGSGDPTITVTGVALACGFYNLGHFASDYRRAFAEPPSQTLRRAKRGRA
jgi:AraC-like DNA-binding protein